MTDINSVTIVGRLVKEPKLETFGNTSKCTISIANNRSVKKGEEWINEVSFFDVVTWGQYADRLSSKVVKGDQVCVSGRLQQARWEKDGQKQSRIYIVADSVQPCSSAKVEGNSAVDTVANAFGGTVAKDTPADLW